MRAKTSRECDENPADPGPDAGMVGFRRTTHPDAQWFAKAKLGLFMHWGVHSVAGIQPSWAMIKDYPHGYVPEYHPLKRYKQLAAQFDPQHYDPDKWMAAASSAGFQYAVLTSKHHDGYALWPSQYGDFSTRQHMRGRDLLGPYVDACRKFGLKVGFYFSPTDWSYPGYPVGDKDFDHNKRGQQTPVGSPHENRQKFEAFYQYTWGQLEELLTRYGTIDLLWFDGIGWPGITDYHTEETLAWVRSIQPGIVVNNRWQGVGDYETPECSLPDTPPCGWWEACDIWPKGHWGYVPSEQFKSLAWFFERLVTCCAWGGNFLCNVGPRPDGTMPDPFYGYCRELAAWMAHSRDALIGAEPASADARSERFLTQKQNLLYVHFLPNEPDTTVLSGLAQPAAVRLLRTGEKLPYRFGEGKLTVSIPAEKRTPTDDVVAIKW